MPDATSFATIPSVLGLACLDALNPATIAAMVLLLSLGRPRAFGSVFILVTFAVYLAAGIALLAGWTAAVQALAPRIPAAVLGSGFILAGLGLLVAAVLLWRNTDAARSPLLELLTPRSSLWAIAALAAVATVSDLPTALPYLAALALLGNESMHGVKVGLLLVAYNLIYVAPAALLLGLRLASGARFAPVSDFIQRAITWTARHLMPPACVLGGIWCLWRGVVMLGIPVLQ